MTDVLPRSQVDVLEQNAMDVLRVVRSIKNTFAPVNRIPPELLSLIPDHFETDNPFKIDKELINLTHVCHGWREIFISRASLWRFLDCANLDKTRVCIQRSRESPLEITLVAQLLGRYSDALLLTIPHIGRLKALTLYGDSPSVLDLPKVFRSPAPLLEKLEIKACDHRFAAIENILFNGDFSSLHELRLTRVATNLPWKDLSNLTTFDFCQPIPGTSMTRLLTFFERAPLLRNINLPNSLPDSSDAPAERVVPLLRLRSLNIYGAQGHSVLLNHLCIPTGALVILGFFLNDRNTQIRDYLPRSLDNLSNISHITSIRLDFKLGTAVWLEGPSGGLRMNFPAYPAPDQRIESLDELPISTTKTLAIHQYRVSEIKVYRTLLMMNNLRTLMLTNCINISFFLVLNPARNASNTVLCPKLEELSLSVPEQEVEFHTDDLLEMAKERASVGAKLSAIVITCPCDMISEDELSSLREHASRVDRILR